MSEYFKYLHQMLAIVGESFEEELRCLGFSITQLNPLEVLEALINAQHACILKGGIQGRLHWQFVTP